MKNLAYILIMSVMVFNPSFVLAKHNFKSSDIPTTEEEVEFQFALLDEVDEPLSQAGRLENGNYQIASFDLAIIASVLGYIYRNTHEFSNNGRAFHDYSLMLDRHLNDMNITDHARDIAKAFEDIPDANSYARGLFFNENFEFADDKRYFTLGGTIKNGDHVIAISFGDSNSTVHIHRPEGTAQILYPPPKPKIKPTKIDEVTIGARRGNSSLFSHVVRQPAEFFPTLLKALRKIATPAAAALAFISMFFASDAEAAEDNATEIAPVVEITPEEYEQIQNDIETARDTLLSLL